MRVDCQGQQHHRQPVPRPVCQKTPSCAHQQHGSQHVAPRRDSHVKEDEHAENRKDPGRKRQPALSEHQPGHRNRQRIVENMHPGQGRGEMRRQVEQQVPQCRVALVAQMLGQLQKIPAVSRDQPRLRLVAKHLVTNCHQGQQAREKRECPIDNGFLPRQILGRHRAPTVLTLHAHPLAVSAESRLTLRTAGAAAITPPALSLRDSPTPY